MENPAYWSPLQRAINAGIEKFEQEIAAGVIGHSLVAKISQSVESYVHELEAECDRLKEQLADSATAIIRMRDAQEDFQGRLWCALGQPENVEFIEAVKQLRAKVAEQDALLKVLAAAEAANRYADQMLTSADLDIAELRAKVAELEGKLAEFKPPDFMEWRVQVRRGALQEALNACCSICRDGRKHEGCPAQPILALIEGGA